MPLSSAARLSFRICRVHQTPRVTPAMEAGLATDQWMIEDLVALMEPKSILDGLQQAIKNG